MYANSYHRIWIAIQFPSYKVSDENSNQVFHDKHRFYAHVNIEEILWFSEKSFVDSGVIEQSEFTKNFQPYVP